ncbi:hypothetical protein B0J12DRAFT_746186 [Macrophomina phaseolina]|uniref:Uncharacterized protein n=1 Tax=Macrophomina phaseolina TaxID=35725 RepID=A0ABQ8FT95_9PEZI|nr:hypothetical protein B0J12DRAFT_746186 [Macrophomina phaseolina]
MAGYRVKLPKELKDSLVSEFEANFDSENDETDSTKETAKKNEIHGPISSQSPTEETPSRSLGSRLKRIVSSDTKLSKAKYSAYYMPKDERKLDRLDLYQQVILRRCGGKLDVAPIEQLQQRILDIGAGN